MTHCPRCFAQIIPDRPCSFCKYDGPFIPKGHFHLPRCPAFNFAGYTEDAADEKCRCMELTFNRSAA